LEDFLTEVAAGHYSPPDRYRADKAWTALLSPYLRFGDLSPRYVFARAQQTLHFSEWKPLVRRLFWRDGAYAQLYRWPMSASISIREQYESEQWNGTNAMLRSWQRGQTGFPLVDAAMRQLWKVGWMPNYLRHVTAQFLIEYLDVNWKEGLKWYDYTLVDSDVAINAMMWQMGGHSGLGAWNFVMHPVFAGKKVDPEGHYVRRWVPELKHLPIEFIHCPWEAPCGCLISANVLLSTSYPQRIIADLMKARKGHARNVIDVRKRFPATVQADGHEILHVNGQRITVRVRDDLKDNSEKVTLLMTPDEAHDIQRRRIVHTKGIHHELLFEESKKYAAAHEAWDAL
jgi:deoxyribodipyrimidine photolyase